MRGKDQLVENNGGEKREEKKWRRDDIVRQEMKKTESIRTYAMYTLTSLSISLSLSESACKYGACTALPPLIKAATWIFTLLAKAEENSPPILMNAMLYISHF
jgi:hypothetical protein